MATVYNKTDYYGLNLYGDNDPADLRDGYNGSMRAVDTTLKKHADRLGTVETKAKLGESIDSALGVSIPPQEGAAAKSQMGTTPHQTQATRKTKPTATMRY